MAIPITEDKQARDTGMTDSPAAVILPNGGLWVFHQGYANNGQLWFNKFGPEGFYDDQLIDETGLTGSPSVLIFSS
jgi:hypothetical protein